MLEALKEEQASKLDSEENLEDQGNLEYIDAFDNIEYIDDLDYLEEDFDEATEEVFPGFRILKRKNY